MPTFETEIAPILPALRRMAERLSRQEADDLIQDSLLKAWLAWDRFDPALGKRSSWLFTILKNSFYSEVRKSRLRPVSMDWLPDRTCDDSHAAWAECIAAQRALSSLSEERRTVLEMRAMGASYVEIAAATASPIGTVMSRLHRARKEFEELLA